MKFLSTNLQIAKHLWIILLLTVSVISCGGGSGTGTTSAGISGTGISSGPITGFGSVIVNGVRYEIDNIEGSENFKVDDSAGASQDDLKIGMVVQISWTSFDNGTTEADTLVYDDSVEGPITSTVEPVTGKPNQKTFTVMGTDVVISSSSTRFDDSTVTSGGISFDNIAQGDVIEVSGFVIDANGTVQATLIEKKSVLVPGSTDTPVEMRGNVTSLSPAPAPPGSSGVFTLNDILVTFDSTTVLEDLPNGLSRDLLVEVKGFYDANDNLIRAREIEGEDDEDDQIGSSEPNTSVSVQGPITGFTNVNNEFLISGVRVLLDVNAIPQSTLDQLLEGLTVEVEGSTVNGVLQAGQIEIREGNSEFKARVASRNLNAQTLEIEFPGVSGTIPLNLGIQSTIEDEIPVQITLVDVQVGDDVKVLARETENEWTVLSLQRQRGEENSYEISGLIDAIIPGVSITIDGLLFPLDSTSVLYGPLLLPNSPNIPVGTSVELEDNDRDGDYEEVELNTF